ncbi:hypothetical protein P5673_000566 [Acropora cervicornis]|uniref:Uncharacterized protein n=1 Tax=Acropora cervicornis TaxID=6130 RepID=A0AAD9R7G3_ACRCE|nr:hypothetical protein P5673_000566 [Acropora cervicornis]
MPSQQSTRLNSLFPGAQKGASLQIKKQLARFKETGHWQSLSSGNCSSFLQPEGLSSFDSVNALLKMIWIQNDGKHQAKRVQTTENI